MDKYLATLQLYKAAIENSESFKSDLTRQI